MMAGRNAKTLPSPKEIQVVTSVEKSTAKVGETESKSCTLVSLKAHYKDKWKTPMAGAMFDLYVNDVKVLSDAKLYGYGSGKEPGTYLYEAEEPGAVRFEITSKHKEGLLRSLKKDLTNDFKAPYQALYLGMKPYNDEWRKNPTIATLGALSEGIGDGAKSVAESFTDLFTAKFWSDVGDSISDTADSVSKAGGEFIDDVIELEWDDVEDWTHTKAKEIKALPHDMMEAAASMVDTIEDGIILAQHADEIMKLPSHMIKGNITEIELFVDKVIPQIDAKLYKDIKESERWQTIIELLYDREALGIILAYMNLFYKTVPPNFIAKKSATLGAMIILEIIIAVVLAILTAGAGTAARFAQITARVSVAAKNGTKLGPALASFVNFLGVFQQSLGKLDKTAKALTASRRAKLVHGATGKKTKNDRDKQHSNCALPKHKECPPFQIETPARFN